MADSAHAQHKRTSSNADDAPHRKRQSRADDKNKNDNSDSEAEEAITNEEIHATETPASESKPRNAFSELMAPKPKPQSTTKPSPSSPAPSFRGRDGLGAYLADPASHPPSTIIFHTPDAVAIRDMFPKATVHCLLLPRCPRRSRMHPFDALSDSTDASFLTEVRAGADRLKALVAAELQRKLGRHSQLDAARNAVLDGDAEGEAPVLPPGRDWAAEVKVGVHAVPSMNHLHVHVLSRDMHSERLKNRKHYNSFTTDFFVPLEDFPLAEDDPRRRQKGWPERPMVCWRCGRDFGNRFKELKEHLEREFEEWRRE